MNHSNTEPLTQNEEFTLFLARATRNGETVLPASELNAALAWSLAARGLLNVVDGRAFLTAMGAKVLEPIVAAVEKRRKSSTSRPYIWKPSPFLVVVKKKA